MKNSNKTINLFYLKDGSPYANSLVKLTHAYRKLDKKKYNTDFIKAFIFFDLFNKIEKILLNPKNALQQFDHQIKKSIESIVQLSSGSLEQRHWFVWFQLVKQTSL